MPATHKSTKVDAVPDADSDGGVLGDLISMSDNKIIPIRKSAEVVRPQPVGVSAKTGIRKPVSSATTINRHVRAAVIRLAFDSCLDINRFAYIAKYAGTRESIALDVIRDYVRDLRAGGGMHPPSGPAGNRRAA